MDCEQVHAASLIHDDLPSMDDDLVRRGRPTNHAVFGVDMAVLAGDALFPLGFEHIVSQTPPELVPETRLLRVIAEIARAVGSTGMAAGQFLDLEGDASVEFVQEKKFGEMAECSAVCGGLLGGAEDEEIERLRKYGRAVGVLYQVVDDVLEAKSKRERGEVWSKRSKSYAGVFGIDRALEWAQELRSKAIAQLDGLERHGDRVTPLYSFVDHAMYRGFVVGGDQTATVVDQDASTSQA
uniref:Heterodimeric geranylgeranyl pyrophosphate synthase small subunit, chloroplastic-like n=1 Tax=Nelumbo nucifera TaxID=4432 RepID=A0A822ZA27_NELNU|nr:TPA_asm: hypothetical protein HUJ06_016060 [Nelumbo nucifera]